MKHSPSELKDLRQQQKRKVRKMYPQRPYARQAEENRPLNAFYTHALACDSCDKEQQELPYFVQGARICSKCYRKHEVELQDVRTGFIYCFNNVKEADEFTDSFDEPDMLVPAPFHLKVKNVVEH